MTDDLRYNDCPSHEPTYPFMVWDFVENTAIAYCWTTEHASKIAKALNTCSLGFAAEHAAANKLKLY